MSLQEELRCLGYQGLSDEINQSFNLSKQKLVYMFIQITIRQFLTQKYELIHRFYINQSKKKKIKYSLYLINKIRFIIWMSIEFHVKQKKKVRYLKNKQTLVRPQSVSQISNQQIHSRYLSRRKTQLHRLMLNHNPSHFKHLNLTTTNWYIYDSKTQKSIGFRESYQRQIASLTKIMTTILSIEIMNRLKISRDLYVKVTASSTNLIGTSASLKANTWITMQNLLYGTMLPSGNDAAFLLAEVLGFFLLGTKLKNPHIKTQKIDLTTEPTSQLYINEFIKEMNNRAYELELINTRYSNSHGLQNAMNLSSAKDILALSVHSAKDPLFSKIMNTEYHNYFYFEDYDFKKKVNKRWWTTNNLLKKGWNGVKTGQTISAGSCLSSLRNGLYIVVLNSANGQTRFTETQRLYNWYEEHHINKLQTVSIS